MTARPGRAASKGAEIVRADRRAVKAGDDESAPRRAHENRGVAGSPHRSHPAARILGIAGGIHTVSYAVLKIIHVVSVVLSFAIFAVRGGNALSGQSGQEGRLGRIVPHVVYTILLLSAVGMVVINKQYPFAAAWPTVKLLGLLAFVVFGIFAFKGSQARKATFFGLGLLAFIFTASVALTHNPWGFLKILIG